MRLSVIICCYNEKATVREIIEASRKVELGALWDREIIVVDNYSTDGTREILQELQYPDVRIYYHEENLGKGASIRTAIEQMTGDYMIIQDADSEYDPLDQRRFCEYAADHNAAAVYGSRILGGEVRYEYVRAYLGVRFLTFLTNVLFGGKLTDVATATKMVRGDLAKSLNLTCSGFDLDFEITNKILLAGYQIKEISISYDPRTYAEGKKIKAVDGLKAMRVMLRDRFGLSPALKPAGEKVENRQESAKASTQLTQDDLT